MKTVFHRMILVLSVPLLVNCSSFYPIKHRLERADEQTINGYRMSVDPENLYQLRVTESVDFITVNEGNGERTLVSDLPYRSFQQDTTQQDTLYSGGPLTIEELYIYMDGIHSKNDSGSNAQYGYILYFITYAAVDGNSERAVKKGVSKAHKYFNDPKKLYINSIRDIFVGYWIKNSNDDLLLFFQLDNGTINVHRGHLYPDRLGFTEVAHPNKNNRNIDSYDIMRQIFNFEGLYGSEKKGVDTIDYGVLDVLFDKIYKSVSLIELDNVFDLNGKEELLFINIPKGKEFVFERKGRTGTSNFYTVEEFIIQDPKFFVNTKDTNARNVGFEFKSKNVQFRTPD